MYKLRGNHLSNATCLTHVFFKDDKQVFKLWSLTWREFAVRVLQGRRRCVQFLRGSRVSNTTCLSLALQDVCAILVRGCLALITDLIVNCLVHSKTHLHTSTPPHEICFLRAWRIMWQTVVVLDTNIMLLLLVVLL